MKKQAFILLMSMLSLLSCNELSKITQFSMPLSQDVSLSKGLSTDSLSVLSVVDVPTNSASFFESNSISPELVGTITLKKFDITLTSPTNKNLSFLKSMEISIIAPDSSVIAWSHSVPDSVGSTLPLDVDSIRNLKSLIINKTSLKLKIKGETRAALDTTTYIITLKPEFTVDLDVLGM